MGSITITRTLRFVRVTSQCVREWIMSSCKQETLTSCVWVFGIVRGNIYGASAEKLGQSIVSGQESDAAGSWSDQWAAMIVSVQTLAVWWFLSCLQGCSHPCLLSQSTLSKLQPLESWQLAARASENQTIGFSQCARLSVRRDNPPPNTEACLVTVSLMKSPGHKTSRWPHHVRRPRGSSLSVV